MPSWQRNFDIDEDWDGDWQEFPDDGYDYKQHMLTEEKLGEIAEQSNGHQQMFLMVPPNLKELEQDPVFKGEIECDPNRLPADERELLLMLQEGREEEEDCMDEVSEDELEEVLNVLTNDVKTNKEVGKQIAHQLLWNSLRDQPMNRMYDVDGKDVAKRGNFDLDEALRQLRADYKTAQDQTESVNADVSVDEEGALDSLADDLLDMELNDIDDEELLAALEEMSDKGEGLSDAEDLEKSTLTSDIQRINQCAEHYIKSQKVMQKRERPQLVDNRAFIEAAVARQLAEEEEEEESISTDEENQPTETYQFDRTLFKTMIAAKEERQKSRNRKPVVLKSAKSLEVQDLIF